MSPGLSRLERGIAIGLTVIVALMPFHAFLSVWLGSLSGHEQILQAWKEGVLALLGLAAIIGLATSRAWRARLRRPTILLAVTFVAVAAVVTLARHPASDGILYGAKTDLEFLLAFILAIIVAPELPPRRLAKMIIIGGTITAIIGLGLVTILPHDSLRHFGYGSTTIAPFEHVDPAIAAIRTPSTLGGPNQFGAYLLLPLALALTFGLRRRSVPLLLSAAVMLSGIVVSYSRAALLGAIVTIIIAILLSLPRRLITGAIAVMATLLVVSSLILVSLTHHTSNVGYYLFHQNQDRPDNPASTTQHVSAFQNGVQVIEATPWGQGLGTAGPASYHTATPFVPESYYLQLGIETGIIGLGLFLMLILRLGYDLYADRASSYASAALAALLGLSLVNLVLHGWADSSTALIYWIFAGAIIGRENRSGPTPQVSILGIAFDNLSFNDAIDHIDAMIATREGGLVATVNAEFVVAAQKNIPFRNALQNAALRLADGSGPTILARYLGTPLIERIPGVDLAERLAATAATNGWRIFLLGGYGDTAIVTKRIWEERYPGIEIVGTNNGSSREEDATKIAREIKVSNADILMVAFQPPRQEIWIDQHLVATGAAIGIGLGGTFDYISGRIIRAPKPMRRVGLEWLYRLYRQPTRFKRMLALPIFTLLVLRHRERFSRLIDK